jgi:hypothetical protein
MNDNPILRPVENGFADVGWTRDGFDVSGRDSNPYLLVWTRRSLAFELRSSITKAQRPIPKGTTDKEASWESVGCPMVRGLNALAVSRFTDNPNSTARRNWRARWESNPRLPNFFRCSIAVELRDCPRSPHLRTDFADAVLSRAQRQCRASANYDGQVVMLTEGLQMADSNLHLLRLLSSALSQLSYPLLMVEDNQQSSAHRNWGDQPDSHRHKRLHGA